MELSSPNQAEMERALRLMKLAFKAANAGAWEWNGETGEMFWTEEYYQVLGIDPSLPPSGSLFLSVVHPEDRSWMRQNVRGAMSGAGRDFRDEHRIVRQGEVRWLEDRGQVITDTSGKVLRVVGISSDITERRRMAEGLQESERRLRTVMDSVPEILFTLGADGRSEFRNKRWLEYTGSNETGGGGRGWVERIHPDDRERCVRLWMACIAEGKPFDAEYRLQRHDGEYRWFRGHAIPLRGEDGQAATWFGVSSDIHENKTLIEQLAKRTRDLEESQQTLAFAQAAARFGVWDWRIHSGEVVWSPELFLLYRLDPVTTQPNFAVWANTIHEDDREETLRLTMESASQRKRLDMQYRTKDGRWMAGIGDVFDDSMGKPERMIGINIDVTLLKRMEDELLQSNEELRRSNEDLQRFASVASHDLQEPLRVISIFSEMLANKHQGKDAQTDQYLAYIRDNVGRTQVLITDLLEYSRISHEGCEAAKPIDLAKPLEDALQALQLKIQETGATVEFAGMPEVNADRTLLAQVFQNLVGNALKYRGSEAPKIQISARREGDEWVIAVKDNGMGFDPKYAESIFGVFRRLHSKSKIAGTGIGLAIVKRIVERHNGRVWAESQPGRGASFYFTLPRGRSGAPLIRGG